MAYLAGEIRRQLAEYQDLVGTILRGSFSAGTAARFRGFFAETLWALNGRGMPFLNRASYLLHGLEFRKEQGYFQVQLDWAGVLEKEADRYRGKGEET